MREVQLAELDNKYPIIFLPIRMETKYLVPPAGAGSPKLRIRFYPDQISFNSFDPRLTRKEVEDAKAYWDESQNGGEKKNLAWLKLTDQYTLPRAAYISKAVINYDPNLEPDPVNPTLKSDNQIPLRDESDNLSAYCDLLPRRFTVYGNFKKPGLQNLRAVGNAISKSIQLNPLDDADTKEADWVTDFDIAVEEGMAIEVELTDEQYESGFDYLLAFGIRDNLSPEETKLKIENLFTGHRYTHGLKLVKQGTATNLVKESKVEQSFASPRHHTQEDKLTYRSIEFGRLDEDSQGTVAPHSPDGRVLSRALGIDNVANGLVNANNYDQLTAASMLVALWPSVLSYFMVKFANIQGLDLSKLKRYFIKYISAQGIIPPISVGKTPYGILPVTLLSNWEDTLLLTGTDQIKTFFNHLKKRWTKYIDKVPTIMSNNSDISDNLLNILSMDAFSQNYNVRGLRSLNYIADFIFEVLGKKNNAGQQIVTGQDLVMKNKLLLNILLKLTFPTIPEGVLSSFYENSLGSGISEIQYDFVSHSENENDLPPDYIEKIYVDIKGPDKNFFKTTKDQATIPATAPTNSDPLLLRLLRYSASLIGEKNEPEDIAEFLESLEILKNINSDRLKTLMLQTLDLVSYRLDAWLTSFANQRLDHLRATKDKGAYVGAFGWIENLVPKKQKVTQEGGYIQASSYAHAAASAVLRNGYITHSNDPGKKDLLKININSERTKEALEMINGIVHTPLPELLGYKLERRLHDANIDYLLDEFRKHFPLSKNDNKKLENENESALERVEPRNLTDGLVVFKIWKRLIDAIGTLPTNALNIRNFMDADNVVPGWKAFYSEIKNKYGETDEKINRLIDQLKPELDFLLEQMDGVSDLCLAESVYQAVNGNFLRAGAVLDGMSGDGLIPLPEIATTPRSGYRRTQRIALAFEADILSNLNLTNPDDTFQWTNPKKLAEPNFNKLLNSYFGTISFWIDIKDNSGNVTSTEEISLIEIGFEPIDLLYTEISDLGHRINYYAKSRGFDNYEIRYEPKDSTSDQGEKRTLVDVQFMIKSLREMVAQGRALNFSDFQNSTQIIKDQYLQNIMDVFQRYYNLILLLLHTIKELQIAKDDVTDLGITKKRQALINASFFESQFSNLLTTEGNIIDSGAELDQKIEKAIVELKARLPEGDSQKEKLSEWKSMFESQGKQTFLESLVDELSGNTENARMYEKTNELLVSQIRKIFNIQAFLILPPFGVTGNEGLASSLEINSRISKWIQKASYVRPRVKLLDEIITYNQILDSSDFSFYCDDTKFKKTAATLNDENEETNPLSLILALSTDAENVQIGAPLENLSGIAGIVADDWTEKIVSKEQDTHIAFHFNGPNSEAPQCLLLAVSPNDFHVWDEPSIRKVILETLTLSKLRGIDYGSIKELRHFLPTSLLNSYGENIFVNLLGEFPA